MTAEAAEAGEADPLRDALGRYVTGDITGARAALGGSSGGTRTASLAARLEAIDRLLGPGGTWPPAGGAATLERLLELEAGLGLPGPSPLAARAAAALADRHAEKGRQLADERRWEEARRAFEAALGRRADHPAARAALERMEEAAWTLYLEGYAHEEDDAAEARRRYMSATRLARPDASLARRIAERLRALAAAPR